MVRVAHFFESQCTCDQVLALTTLIENGFQMNLKPFSCMNLTAAYDIVWLTGLLLKLAKFLPAWVPEVIALMLRDRRVRVHMGEDVSRWRIQKNGLPQ